jgi:hypothetical protein
MNRFVFTVPYTGTISGERTLISSYAKTYGMDHPAPFQLPPSSPPNSETPEGCQFNPARRSSYTFTGDGLTALLHPHVTRQALDETRPTDAVTISSIPENMELEHVFSGPRTHSTGPYCDDSDKQAVQRQSRFLKCFYQAPTSREWFGENDIAWFPPTTKHPESIWLSCKAGFCDADTLFIPGIELQIHHYVAPDSKPIEAMKNLVQMTENALRASEVKAYPWPAR